MAGLKELRTRIESIKSTQKITSAMKMVAASKYRRAQLTLDKSELFQKMIIRNIKNVLVAVRAKEAERGISFVLPRMLQQPQNPKRYALFVLASDRGLCGNYNLQIAKEAKRRIDELHKQGKETIVFCYGKKGYTALSRLGFTEIEGSYPNVIKKHLTYEEALSFLNDVCQKKEQYHADICEIVYSDFLSGLSRVLVSKQVVPFGIELTDEDVKADRVGDAFYDYQPDMLSMLTKLSDVYMRTAMFEVLINSQASEHAARLGSMDNANRNAREMISSLTFKYNSLRQSAITTELTEIVAGAEAM